MNGLANSSPQTLNLLQELLNQHQMQKQQIQQNNQTNI